MQFFKLLLSIAFLIWWYFHFEMKLPRWEHIAAGNGGSSASAPQAQRLRPAGPATPRPGFGSCGWPRPENGPHWTRVFSYCFSKSVLVEYTSHGCAITSKSKNKLQFQILNVVFIVWEMSPAPEGGAGHFPVPGSLTGKTRKLKLFRNNSFQTYTTCITVLSYC